MQETIVNIRKRGRCPEAEDNTASIHEMEPPRKKKKHSSIRCDTKEEEGDESHFLSNYISSTIIIHRTKDHERFDDEEDDDNSDTSRKMKFNILKPQTPAKRTVNKDTKLETSPNWVRLSDILSNAFKYNTSTQPTTKETKKEFIHDLHLFIKRNCVKQSLDTFYTSLRGRYYISEKAFCILLIIMKDFDSVSHHVQHFCNYRFYYRHALFGTKIASFNPKKPRAIEDMMICTRCCLEDIEANFTINNPCDCSCSIHTKCNAIHHEAPTQSDDWFCAFCKDSELSMDELRQRRKYFNESGDFEVERVIDYDAIEDEYVVKWKYYPDDACCNTPVSISFIESIDAYWNKKHNRNKMPLKAQRAIDELKAEAEAEADTQCVDTGTETDIEMDTSNESSMESLRDIFIPVELCDVMDGKYIIRRQKYTKETYERMKETQDKHRKRLLKAIKKESVIGLELKREMKQNGSNHLPRYHLQSINSDWDCDLPRIHDIITSFLSRNWDTWSPSSVSCDSFVIGDIVDTDNPAKKYGIEGKAYGLFAVKKIPKDTLLFEYSGCVKPIGAASAALDHLETELSQTTLFDLIGHLDEDRSKLFWGKKPNDQLVIDPSKWHNEGIYMNDYRDRVMDDPDDDEIKNNNSGDDGDNINDDKSNKNNGGNDTREQNVKFYEVLVNNWPRVFAVAISDINVGNELLGDYGNGFWSNFRLMMRRQKQLKEIKMRINREWQAKYDELMEQYRNFQIKTQQQIDT